MNRKWSYFAGAATLVTFALLKAGAPLFTILLGVVAAALLTARTSRRPV
jgi:predicted branched-subunit amino acid permease